MFDPESPTATTSDQSSTEIPPKPATVPHAAAAPSYPFRLLTDEEMLGVFPIARAERPFGRLASFLFVTDSRLVYSAEAKTISSASIHNKEFHIHKIDGIEVGRHSGYDALGLVALLGSALNFLGLLIMGLVVGAASANSSSYFGSSNPFDWFGALLIPFAITSLVLGVVVAFVFRKPQASIRVIGPDKSQTLSEEQDLPKLFVMLLLFLVFGFFVGLVVLVWLGVRELGVFRATDAQKFAPVANVDAVAHHAGALILDVQARGKLAEKI